MFATLPPELFEPTTAMAANQGLHNGFLAAELIWSLLIMDRQWRYNVALCFLIFVAIAGVFGGMTVSPRIALIQTAPALLAIILATLARKR